ncbi:hypothetical protein BGW80DRAFT_1454584 [Lactifluus volemus]|nr:hypothetical protein BGW80DRAFT_1454584 [Lactifluus volemus]
MKPPYPRRASLRAFCHGNYSLTIEPGSGGSDAHSTSVNPARDSDGMLKAQYPSEVLEKRHTRSEHGGRGPPLYSNNARDQMQPIYERRPEYGTRSATDQKMGSGEGVETQDVYVQMQTILVNDCGIAPLHVLGSVSRDGLQPADPGVPPLKHEYEEARVGKCAFCVPATKLYRNDMTVTGVPNQVGGLMMMMGDGLIGSKGRARDSELHA